MRQNIMPYRNVIDSISRKTGIDGKTVKQVMDAFIDTVIRNTMCGKTVQLDNFGSFKLRFLRERIMARNYISGQMAVAPQHFKLSLNVFQPVREKIANRYTMLYEQYREDHKEELENGKLYDPCD